MASLNCGSEDAVLVAQGVVESPANCFISSLTTTAEPDLDGAVVIRMYS